MFNVQDHAGGMELQLVWWYATLIMGEHIFYVRCAVFGMALPTLDQYITQSRSLLKWLIYNYIFGKRFFTVYRNNNSEYFLNKK